MTIEDRLAAATTALHEQLLTGRLVAQLKARMDAAADELAVLRNRLDDEQADVDKLEKPSLSRFLASLRGQQGDVDKERAEAEAARLAVADAKARFDTLRTEHLAARDRLAKMANAPAEHAAALEEKERYLAESGDPRGAELAANGELRGRITGELTEIRQALGAADNVHLYLSEVRERITKATLWSGMDVLSPGLSGRSEMLEAVDKVHEGSIYAGEWLATLKNELADIGEEMPELPAMDILLPKWWQEWTVYVNGLPVYDNVFPRVLKAGNNTGEAIAIIDALRKRLESRETSVAARLAQAERERAALHA
ncbi:hypothetical protein KZZ52_04425 [Dactylosporangium sp. AC04546]|uniref:hypothetical protein n=1 Tax=Dactylosporangium sp. AC04546 TaxID=2862460 RepID=UPI001EE100B5|nr:hypothetical protein [Dactylosporangium sp. AC04546]WVK84668.1 hypothetical protein KZZ52_04425 [Dactylosporangium sp. AC04546]